MKDPRSVILKAMMTEKGAELREKQNSYVFKVHPDANKIEIGDAIHAIFHVDVVSVRTMNVLGKRKRLGRTSGRRSSWKKAVVTLKSGQTIELFDQV